MIFVWGIVCLSACTALKNRLAKYAAEHPDLCRQTDDDEQGGLTFEIDRRRFAVRLTAPYSDERRHAASELAKKNGLRGRAYALNIEYLYEQKEDLVATVFDRLNRNGEPLTRQELRNAKYSDSSLLKTIKELTGTDFWNDKLSRLKSVRMEDIEFISELFFLVAENRVLDSSQETLDLLYEQYRNDDSSISKAQKEFESIVTTINTLKIDFETNKRLCWTTHLYSLFSLVWLLNKQEKLDPNIGAKINDFYTAYFSKTTDYAGSLKAYKEASSSRTRSESQRKKRLSALAEYCGIQVL